MTELCCSDPSGKTRDPLRSDLSCSCAKREVKLIEIHQFVLKQFFSIIRQITWNVLHTTENLGIILGQDVQWKGLVLSEIGSLKGRSASLSIRS